MTTAVQSYYHRLTALALAYEANIPLLIWGPPGEGKSSVVSAFAHDRGLHAEVVITSLREPTDLNGLPLVAGDGTVRLAPPAWLTASNAHDGSLVVLDEITTAPPATRAAALRVVNERVSADTPLNPTTRFVAIANPPEVAEDGWELGAPMSNRFVHLRDWELPAETFALGIATGQWTRVPAITVDQEKLARQREELAAAVAGFLRDDPSLRSRLPEHPADRQYPWPSPRSWTMCIALLAHARCANVDDAPVSDDVIALLVEGCIGPVAAPPFLAFLSALKLPDPEVLLADPTGWEVPQRGDLTWAVLTRLNQYLVGLDAQATKQQWRSAGKVIAHAAEQQGDVAVAAAQDWWAHARIHGPAVMPPELASGRFANVISLLEG